MNDDATIEQLSPDDRGRVLAWGTGPTLPAPDCTLHALVAQAIARRPEAVAVVQGAQRTTYEQLDAAADRVAAALQGLGAGPGRTVAVCLSRAVTTPAVLLGVLRSGAAYLPVDPALPAERVALLCAEAEPLACIVDPATRATALPTGVPVRAVADLIDAPGAGAVRPGGAPDDLAYVLFTSGSTGRPKGVCIEHRAVVDFVVHNAAAYGVTADSRVLAMASLGFDVSVAEIFTALVAGATLVVARDDERQDPEALAALLRRERIDVAELPPALLALLDPASFPDLRLVSVGGEAPSAPQVARWTRAGIRVVNAYGPTETTVSATLMDCDAVERASVPIGRPMPNHRVYVVDEAGRLLPPGRPGELWIAGAGLARGYLGAPELTAQRFVPNPFGPGRVYRTGDRVCWTDGGLLEFLGRVDDQINLRGYRVEPAEIEARLRAHPGVADGAVIVDEAPSGARLVAFVVGEGGGTPDRLEEWMAQALPAYECPSAFVHIPALPLTSTGKTDRAALRTMVAGRAARVPVAPRTSTEEHVLAMWRELLADAGEFGVEDDFLDLGGHSLLAMMLLSRLQRCFGVRVSLADLADAPTVAAVARLIDSSAPVAHNAPVLQRRADPEPPLSRAQRRLLFAEKLDPGRPTYHLPAVYRLHGAVDAGRLRAALEVLARRHDVLRTTFGAVAGQPRCRVHRDVVVPFAQARVRTSLAAACADVVRQAFDIEGGLLWRAALISAVDGDALILVLHHAIADGWSMSILLRELGDAYAGADELPDLEVQYGDFTAWQEEWLAGAEFAASLEHWKQALAGAPSRLQLPADRPRPPRQTFTAGRVRATVPPPLAAGVASLAAARATTPYPVLLAAYALALGRLAGTEDVVVSCPVAGRTDPRLEYVVGLLVDAVPVRLDLTKAAGGVAEFVTHCARAVRQAQSLAAVPFESLVQALAPTRDPSRAPIAQAGFNLLSYPPERLRLPGVATEELEVDPPGSLLDLTLYLRAVPGGGWDIEAVYNADLFDAERITALVDSYLAVLHQVVAEPAAAAASLTLVTEAARAVLPDPSAPLAGHESPTPLRRFVDQVAQHPDRPAVGDRSYADVHRASDAVAGTLAAGGIGSGDVVAVPAVRSELLPVALLGVAKSGAAVHLVDAAHPPARIANAVTAAGASAWLALDAATPPRSAWRFTGDVGSILAAEALPVPPRGPDPEAAAFLLCTSGSTGTAKAVVSTSRPLAHFVEWYAATFALTADDRFALVSGVAHDPVLRDVLMPLAIGASVHVPPAEVHQAPDRLLAWLAQQVITVLHATPQLARLLASAAEAAGTALPALRVLGCAGDVLRGSDVPRLAALAPNAALVSGYGATETPQWAGWQPMRDEGRERVPLGRGIDGTQLLVCTETGAPAGIGELGEIVVRSRHLAQGYAGQPSNRFLVEPSGVARYRTGDRGRFLPDGRVEFVGRDDGQCKIRGFRVEVGEVLDAVRGAPSVLDAAVIAATDSDGEARLVAYVVPRDADPAAVRQHLRQRLPEAAVPASVVGLDALPLTVNGKLDTAALPAPVRQPAPAATPELPLELQIAAAWKAVLGLASVGVDDNFFDVGGTSLRLIEIQTRLRDTLGRTVSVVDLYQFPTIRALAKHLGGTTHPAHTSHAVRLEPGHGAAARRIDARRNRQRGVAAVPTAAIAASG